LNDWCNPVIDGIRSGKPGNYKNTLQYFELIADKFYNSAIEDGNIDWIFFDNKLELKNRGMALYKGMRDFVRALRDGDIKGKIERYIMDDKRWREDQMI